MARCILLTFFLASFIAAYEEVEWRKNAKPNYDLDYMIFGEDIAVPESLGANPHIVGGIESVQHSRPHQLGLFIPVTGGNSFCGGSLINVLTAITAAHCVDTTPGNVSIIAGAHTITQDEPTQQIRFSTVIVLHPQWSRPTLANDIAILRWEEPMIINQYVATINLPRNPTALYTGNHSLVSGWGRPADSVNTISPILREVQTPVIPNIVCRMAYVGIVTDDHICISGHYGRGTCNGDSGGPLMVNGVLIGVVSFGSAQGCEVGWPPAFARVTSYLEWIAANSADVTNTTNPDTSFEGSEMQYNLNRELEGPLDPEFNVDWPQEISA